MRQIGFKYDSTWFNIESMPLFFIAFHCFSTWLTLFLHVGDCQFASFTPFKLSRNDFSDEWRVSESEVKYATAAIILL
jgi:hypothetical protein